MKVKGLILFIILLCNTIGAYAGMSFSPKENNNKQSLEQLESQSDFSDNEEFTFTTEIEEEDDAHDCFMEWKGMELRFTYLNNFSSKQALVSCIREFLKPPCLQ